MTSDPRIGRTVEQMAHALDAHLFTLRSHLQNLGNSASHLKVIAAELRVLVCRSAKIEGLLWRMTEALSVDDGVYLNLAGDLDTSHPLAKDLSFMIAPMSRGHIPHPHFKPDVFSLKEVIKESQAVVATGKPLTHEYLISALAQQMGSAHEADKVAPELVQLSSIFLGGVEPYVGVLALDAQLVLEVGERVLECAEQKLKFVRQMHSHNYGNVSAFVRIHIKQLPLQPVRIWSLHSHCAPATVELYLSSSGTELRFSKRGEVVLNIADPFSSPVEGYDFIDAFSYCSKVQKLRTFFEDNDSKGAPPRSVDCELGWVHATDLEFEKFQETESVELQHFFLYDRLITSEEALKLTEPNAGGLFIAEDELLDRGPFPY